MPQLDVVYQRRGSRILSPAAALVLLASLLRLREDGPLAGQLEEAEDLVLLEPEDGAVGVLPVVVQGHMHVQLCAVDEERYALPAHENPAVVKLTHLLPSRLFLLQLRSADLRVLLGVLLAVAPHVSGVRLKCHAFGAAYFFILVLLALRLPFGV